jgi:hypothetical protein
MIKQVDGEEVPSQSDQSRQQALLARCKSKRLWVASLYLR